jgi:hypothetical protein
MVVLGACCITRQKVKKDQGCVTTFCLPLVESASRWLLIGWFHPLLCPQIKIHENQGAPHPYPKEKKLGLLAACCLVSLRDMNCFSSRYASLNFTYRNYLGSCGTSYIICKKGNSLKYFF